ncbi:MAG: sodium:solute symporter family protein [Candidatus Bathyarchaeia archaeon]
MELTLESMALLSGVIVYLAIIILIGYFAYKRGVKTAIEYFIAGRGFGTVVLTISTMAAVYSGWFFLGGPGMGYRFGLTVMTSVPGYCILAFFIVKYIWSKHRLASEKFGYITASDIVGSFFKSDLARILTAAVAVAYCLPYVVTQLHSVGIIISGLSGGQLPYELGFYILTAGLLIYVLLGGLRGVVWTSVMQGILLLSFVFVSFGLIVYLLGGYTAALSTMPETHMVIPGPVPLWEWQYGLSLGIVTIFGIFSSPVYVLFANSIRGGRKDVERTINFISFGFWASIMTAIYISMWVVVWFGIKAIVGEIPSPDWALPTLMLKYTPVWVLAIFAGAVIAACQSTADATLHTAGVAVGRDIAGVIKRGLSERWQIIITRLTVTAIILLTLFVLVKYLFGMIVYLGAFATAYGLQMLPAWLGIYYAPPRLFTKWGVVAGIIAGLVVTTFTYPLAPGWPLSYPFKLHCGMWGIFANFVTCLIVSRFTRPVDEKWVKEFREAIS